MSERITNVEIQEFLTSFEKESETTILEEGKEKNELEKIAEARGIKIKGSRDLAVFKTIYAFTDKANANGAILPKKELLKVLPQIVGKPININHDRRMVVGNYIDYRYKQKENQVIAYGTFFKSNFGEEFEEAKKLLKKKKLSSSFEIWSPKDKRKFQPDGSFEMHQMEIAGGALIYEDADNEPAFKDAKVLTMAKENIEAELELVYASKHKEEELITSAGEITTKKVEIKNPTDTTVVVPSPTIQKIKCSNCSEELEYNGIDIKVKCPKCFAILNKDGVMQYPPQIKDFKLLCPACKVNNWLIVSKKDDKAQVRCSSCSKEYNITFATETPNKLIDKIQFLYTGKVRCLQCHTSVYVSGTSAIKNREIECKKCGLAFSYDITHERYKKISQIKEVIPKEIKIDNKKESSEEGGQKMAKEKKVEKASEKKIEVKKEKVESKKEVKEKKKIEVEVETPKVELKVEKKEEAKETPKAEKTPKTAEKVEEPKDKEKVKVKKDEKKVEVKDKTKVETKEKVKEQPEAKAEVKEAPKTEEPKVENKIEKKEAKVKEKTIIEQAKEAPEEKAESVTKVEKEKVKATKKEKSDLVRRAVGRILDTKKALRKAQAENTVLTKKVERLMKAVELLESSAKDIIKRREELGDYAKEMSDEDILNDDKFGKAKAEKENTILRASKESDGSEIVGSKVNKKDDAWYGKKRKAIDNQAFTKKD